MELIPVPMHESIIPRTSSYVVRWDSSEFLNLFTHITPHFTANVVSHCVRVEDPFTTLSDYLRLLCQLDGPCESPKFLLRIWHFEHSVMTPLDLPLINYHRAQIVYVVSRSGLRRTAGPDVVQGEAVRPTLL